MTATGEQAVVHGHPNADGDAAVAGSVPRQITPPESRLLYTCDGRCGFKATFEVVAAHEAGCPAVRSDPRRSPWVRVRTQTQDLHVGHMRPDPAVRSPAAESRIPDPDADVSA